MVARDVAPGALTFDVTLAAAQAGAPWACRTLWLDYASAVSGFLAARGSREPDDLTSEVFLAVFDSLSTFTGGESEFRSFVFSIAYRRLTDELRKRSRRGETFELSPESDPRRATSAEDEAQTRLADAAAMRLLDRLPEDQRNVMVLRIVADLTIEQIAAILGKRPDAVKALQRRALASLQKKVSPTRTLLRPRSDSGK